MRFTKDPDEPVWRLDADPAYLVTRLGPDRYAVRVHGEDRGREWADAIVARVQCAAEFRADYAHPEVMAEYLAARQAAQEAERAEAREDGDAAERESAEVFG